MPARPEPPSPAARPRVVIVGGGFGGLAAARALAGEPVEVTLVDRANHHLFQPLLYQVATAGLSPADIAAPIRSILACQKNAHVVLGEVTGVDTAARQVALSDGRALPYEYLVLATGARHSYFGRDEWAAHAPGLKTLDDALAIRRRVLLALERAEGETDPARRKALLTFVVVGGGPTGVEMAGAIAELARQSASEDFRSIMPGCTRVILVEGGPRVLAAFPEALSAAARRGLERLGVEVRTDCRVEAISADSVVAGGEHIATHTTVWAAGVMASPAARWLGLAADRSGRAQVGADLRPAGLPDVFVVGDTACVEGPGGRPLPGLAAVAKQQGRHAGRAIAGLLRGRAPGAFAYRDWGSLATIGRASAVADFGRVRLTGFTAWATWCVAHLWFLAGYRNRFVVGATWLWNYLTFERGARLITGADAPATPSLSPAQPRQEALAA